MSAIPRMYEYLEEWLKFDARADVSHCVLRFDGTRLISYCGRDVQVQETRKPVMGVRHCTECHILQRRRIRDREKANQTSGGLRDAAGK